MVAPGGCWMFLVECYSIVVGFEVGDMFLGNLCVCNHVYFPDR